MDNVTELPTAVNEQITLTNEQINHFGFMQAFGRLRQMSLGPKTAYTISYIAEHVDRHVSQGRKIFTDIAKKYAELDEAGNLKPELDKNDHPIPGTFLFKSDEDKEAFEKDQKEFMSIEHEINKRKLSVSELGSSQISANDILALTPLFCDLDD